MTEKENKIIIECECADTHALISLEYLKNFEEFLLSFYRKYKFRKKNEIAELIISKDSAKELINFLKRFVEEKKGSE